MIKRFRTTIFLFILTPALFVGVVFTPGLLAKVTSWSARTPSALAAIQDEINQRNQQIADLERQIGEYQKQIDDRRGKASSLSNEIAIMNAQINSLQLEIRSLSLSISKTGSEIEVTNQEIGEAVDRISRGRASLAEYLRTLNALDQEDMLQLLFKHERISDFFGHLDNIETTQANITDLIDEIRIEKERLDAKEDALLQKKAELVNLQSIQEQQKRSAELTKSQKNNLLKVTKGEESKYQNLVKKTKTDIEKIRAQIFYLQQNGVSAEDAVTYGQLAAISQGIRPAFLLGILEIESGLGKNVGTGNWLSDMYNCYKRLGRVTRAEQEKAAFLKIVNSLGLDPDSVKVSREPNYGCGGAMGPAQFIATTWLGYAEEVARITGHNPPNPWNVQDAFTASAIKLARGGANQKTRAGEIAAAKAYISGNSKCATSTCNSYANAVLRKADQIEQNL